VDRLKIYKLLGIDFHHEIRKINFKAKITEYHYGLKSLFFLIFVTFKSYCITWNGSVYKCDCIRVLSLCGVHL